jgi:uncharacterized protein (DUF2249 family)
MRKKSGAKSKSAPAPASGGPRFRTLDVRPILARGEEPFATIRARLRALARGQGLRIVAPFVPAPLIEMVRSEGFSTALARRGDGGWEVCFWRE